MAFSSGIDQGNMGHTQQQHFGPVMDRSGECTFKPIGGPEKEGPLYSVDGQLGAMVAGFHGMRRHLLPMAVIRDPTARRVSSTTTGSRSAAPTGRRSPAGRSRRACCATDA